MNVLALSIGRNILQAESRERARMRAYAHQLEEFHIVVLTRKEHNFQNEVHEGNLHLYPTNSRTRVGMLVDAWRIARHCIKRQRAPIVISSQDPFEIGFVCYLLSWYNNTRLHIQIHGDYFGSPYWKRGSLVKQFRLWVGHFILNRAERIRVVSERIKRSLVALGISEARITVLPIRPELETFLQAGHTVGDHTPFIFLAASRFSPEKNLPLIVRAFAAVHTQYPHTQLRLVGKGKEETTVRALIAELRVTEAVSIVPWTDAIEREMQKADVFVLASNHEAYALTLIEAMAVGLPLVTTDVGCVGEVVIHRTHGLVVPVGDEAAFTKAMGTMVEDTALRMACSAAGRQTAQRLAHQSSIEYARAWVAALSSSEVNV